MKILETDPILSSNTHHLCKIKRLAANLRQTISEILTTERKIMATFFTSLVGDISRQLRLPRAFLVECGEGVCGNVQLRRSGKKWNVELERLEEGSLCFTRGWQKFAADVGLREGEHVVFVFRCDATFDVLVYGKDCCEKRDVLAIKYVDDDDEKEDEEEDDDEEDGGGDDKSNPLYFEIKFKQHHGSRVLVPAKFRSAAGLNEKECVRLTYGDNEAVVKLKHRKYLHMIARGWNEFWKASGMVFGNTYSFEFKPSRNVIQVKEVNRGE